MHIPALFLSDLHQLHTHAVQQLCQPTLTLLRATPSSATSPPLMVRVYQELFYKTTHLCLSEVNKKERLVHLHEEIICMYLVGHCPYLSKVGANIIPHL